TDAELRYLLGRKNALQAGQTNWFKSGTTA
ncbi:MAG: hypothetical protein ACI9XZ_003085, partial [Alphaproteobacteria bacterium]